MLIFPQLSSGASIQYPLNRQLSQRVIQSAMEDGTIIALADVAANYLEWRITFRDLSDQEAVSLRDFFAATQGNLQPFVFLDPAVNLLVWSEDFSQAAWQTAGLTFDNAVADPFGTTRASRAHNPSAANLTIAQQTQIPGMAQVCFSVYLRSDVPVTVALTQSAGTLSQSISVAVTNTWQRFYLSGMFLNSSDPSQLAVGVPPGAALELFGPQADAQVNPSEYVTGVARAGVYTSARFDMKQIDITVTGPNRNACVVSVRCNLPAGE